MVTARSRKPALDPAIADYVATVRALEYVERVVMSDAKHDEGVPIVWTIIDAPPWDDAYALPIIHAESDANRRSRAGVDHWLTNIQERARALTDSELDGWVTLFVRGSSAAAR